MGDGLDILCPFCLSSATLPGVCKQLCSFGVHTNQLLPPLLSLLLSSAGLQVTLPHSLTKITLSSHPLHSKPFSISLDEIKIRRPPGWPSNFLNPFISNIFLHSTPHTYFHAYTLDLVTTHNYFTFKIKHSAL